MNISVSFQIFLFLVVGLINSPKVSGVANSVPLKGDAAPRSALPAANSFCPFCAALNATFAEQISKHEITVIAKLAEVPPQPEEPAEEFPKAKFEILQVLKGEQFVAKGMAFQTMLVGKYKLGETFLVMGVEPPAVMWSTPMQASERVIKYLIDGRSLPASGPDRLAFFQDYFEDEDSVIAFDAYDEYAIADYKDLIAMKDRIKRDRLIKWINDPELRIERRRLYLTMLAVCDNKADIAMLEGFLLSDDPSKREGLDALAAAYLTLKGEAGIPLLEEHFLSDFDEAEDTAETNAVLAALRFHGTEVDQIPRARIAQAVRLALKHPQLADTVIPDLARWEDWSVIEQLVDLFKNCDDDYQYVRVPVVAYLHACPKPEAKQYLKELEAIDPDAVRRARFFMGEPMDDEFGGDDEDDTDDAEVREGEESGSGEKRTPESSQDSSDDGTANQPQTIAGEPVSIFTTASRDEQVVAAADSAEADQSIGPEPAGAKPDNDLAVPVSTLKTETAGAFTNLAGQPGMPSSSSASSAVNNSPVAIVSPGNITWLIVFVPLGFSLVCFILIWSVVNGWFERLII